ncbi:histidine phosphotransferase family protein [Salipiger marinus]|uniref:histidine phosphotransferase family protein n=1 Tax=Salipiger marinus TaxID=555512 RepID=UPI000E84884A|nr:hypothetical protein [Citreicella sp.]
MFDDSAKLATLVGSRLCHDLVSPIGAIRNGLELVALSGAGGGSEEMTLIEDSCASAAARIAFFRIAFGSAKGEQMIGRREITKLLAEYCRGGRIMPDWQPTADTPRPTVQLVLLGWLCCESALPQGGTITVSTDGTTWRLSAAGPRLQLEPDVWAQLSTTALAQVITPARVQFACLSMLAAVAGRQLEVADQQGAVTLLIR